MPPHGHVSVHGKRLLVLPLGICSVNDTVYMHTMVAPECPVFPLHRSSLASSSSYSALSDVFPRQPHQTPRCWCKIVSGDWSTLWIPGACTGYTCAPCPTATCWLAYGCWRSRSGQLRWLFSILLYENQTWISSPNICGCPFQWPLFSIVLFH